MTRALHLAASLLALALSGVCAAATQPMADEAAAKRLVANPSSREAYDRGFGDGLYARKERERDNAYREGYLAGRAKQAANESRPDGREYARGYREGYDRYRERVVIDQKNRAYAVGFQAGQSDRNAFLSGRADRAPAAAPMAAAASVDKLVGRPTLGLDNDMKTLGFVRMSQFKKGPESFSTWSSKAQNRCVRITARDGKVKELSDVDTDRCT